MDIDRVKLSIVSKELPDLNRKQNLRKKKSHSLAKLTKFLPSRITQEKITIGEQGRKTLKSKSRAKNNLQDTRE